MKKEQFILRIQRGKSTESNDLIEKLYPMYSDKLKFNHFINFYEKLTFAEKQMSPEVVKRDLIYLNITTTGKTFYNNHITGIFAIRDSRDPNGGGLFDRHLVTTCKLDKGYYFPEGHPELDPRIDYEDWAKMESPEITMKDFVEFIEGGVLVGVNLRNYVLPFLFEYCRKWGVYFPIEDVDVLDLGEIERYTQPSSFKSLQKKYSDKHIDDPQKEPWKAIQVLKDILKGQYPSLDAYYTYTQTTDKYLTKVDDGNVFVVNRGKFIINKRGVWKGVKLTDNRTRPLIKGLQERGHIHTKKIAKWLEKQKKTR